MKTAFRDRWFPQSARRVPGARPISIALRTIHLAAFGFLLGGHAFGADPGRLLPYLYVTILTGLGLIALEVRALGAHWLFLGKGVAVAVKLAVLLLIPLFWEARVPLLLLVVAIASVSSHMPGRFRYYSLLQRREVGKEAPLRLAGAGEGRR